MRILLLVMLLLSIPIVFADRILITSPSGKTCPGNNNPSLPTHINTCPVATCGTIDECYANVEQNFCNEEGTWTIKNMALVGTVEQVTATRTYIVNWEAKKYCRLSCMPNVAGVKADPRWIEATQLCCGDDPFRFIEGGASGGSVGGGGSDTCTQSTSITTIPTLTVAAGGGFNANLEYKIEYYKNGAVVGSDTITWQVPYNSIKTYQDGTIAHYERSSGALGPNGEPNTASRFSAPSSGTVTKSFTPSASSFDSIKIILSSRSGNDARQSPSSIIPLTNPYNGGQATIQFNMRSLTALEWGGVVSCCTGGVSAEVSNMQFSFALQCTAPTPAPIPVPTPTPTGPVVDPNSDCGKKVNNHLCIQVLPQSRYPGHPELASTRKVYDWISLQGNKGEIFKDLCSNTEIVSMGDRFVSCGESKNPRIAGTSRQESKKVLYLDGASNYVSLGNLDLPGEFTIMSMIRPTVKSSTQKVHKIISKWGSDPAAQSFKVEVLDNGLVKGTFGTNEGDVSVTSVTKVFDGNWHHFALRKEQNTAQLYIDGFLERSVSLPGTVRQTSTQTRIGSEVLQSSYYYKGLMDNLLIYGRVLNSDDIMTEYNNWWTNKSYGQAGLQNGYLFEDNLADVKNRNAGTSAGATFRSFKYYLADPSAGVTTTSFSMVNLSSNPIHGYACYVTIADDPYTEEVHIAECPGGNVEEGSSSPHSSANYGMYGDALDIGDKISGITGLPSFPRDMDWYCNTDGSWVTDLDNNELACKQAGFKWTGRRCCSEDDDRSEFYNDPYFGLESDPNFNTGGACWNKTYVGLGSSPYNDAKIMNINGSFFGCNIASDSELLDIDDELSVDNEKLVKNKGVCSILKHTKSNSNIFCSSTGRWLADTKGNRSHLSITPTEFGSAQTSECCSQTECWDGSKCVANQVTEADDDTTHDYRCINGNWIKSELKYNWNMSKRGFCEFQSQCLVNPDGKYKFNNQPHEFFNTSNQGGPQCIADGQSIEDNYCDNGNWTTRTKLLAITMLNMAKQQSPSDYSLYCDNFNSTLTRLDYAVNTRQIRYYLTSCTIGTKTVPCTNNFCVLKYGDKIAFGTSLNENISNNRGILAALEKPVTQCNTVQAESSTFSSCGNNIYYNPKTRSIIITTAQASGFSGAVENFMAPFNAVKNLIFTLLNPEAMDFSFFNGTRMFQKVYAVGSGNRNMFAFFEPKRYDPAITAYNDYISVHYTGINVNICDSINSYAPNAESNSKATCNKVPGREDYLITARRTDNFGILNSWNELTGKLRP